GPPERVGGSEKKVRVGFGVYHPVASDHGYRMRSLQQGERGPGDHIVAAGRDRPRHPEFRQHVEQLLRPGKRPDLSDATGVRLLVKLAQSVRLVRTDIAAGFADERAHEKAADHTDAA